MVCADPIRPPPTGADAQASWPLPDRFDFGETTRLLRTGRNDPTVIREADGLWRTGHTEQGPSTVRLVIQTNGRLDAYAWGDGSQAVLDTVPAWLGLDRPEPVLPPHPVTDRLLQKHPGVRLNDTGNLFEALVNIVLQQQITWNEAACNWRRLCEVYGEPAPGRPDMRLSPAPRELRRADLDRIMRLGIRRQQAMTLKELAQASSGLNACRTLPTAALEERLQSLRGIGPWTTSMALGMRLGRPEPLVRGDVHLPHVVSWTFERQPRGSDARMEALLAPFAEKMFYVIRLLHAARIEAPRRSPKRALQFNRG